MRWMKRTAAAIVAGILVSSAMAADWPQFLGPHRDETTSAGGKLARSWPADGPKELWHIDLGDGFGSAAIESGKVYVLDRVPGKQDVLRCLDLSSGKELWTYAYDQPGADIQYAGSRSTPAVDSKCVYTVGCFGDVLCVDKETHQPLWKHNLIEDFAGKLPHWGVAQSPVLYKDYVIVAPQSAKAGVVAYKKATGELAWQSEPIGSWDTSYISPAIVNIAGQDQVMMASQVPGKKRVNVVGLDPSEGKILWTFDKWACNIPIPSPVSCGDDRFFITGGYGAGSALFKVEKKGDAFAATELWNDKGDGAGKDQVISSHLHGGVFYKDHLYVNGNSKQNSNSIGLACVDVTEHNIVWKTGKKPGIDMGDVILVDDLLLTMDGASGTLRLAEANPDAYKQLAEAKVLNQNKQVWADMAFADGKLIVRDDKVMKCLDLEGK